ncbi:MAG: hypothetical protein A3I04_02945 [Nitrospinae bacterium RIFCSPLOWO2_02_FULL_39_110]|nr:MAG: hypothetical protein A3D97_05050 [Nitrospinae bacterium RIFCSPHIGHO2_12_FULL_39_42]OGW02552.1 MAG: hypothetical protein A3D20_04155 [Nitrospinae bacterium RIFCSPHIGHO2_02_FULL_39_82]OGW07147.1 MAG: hypothetical protein A3I04_02945 [Nitrospinae bacterium RIFCSPLOWO2_02_FULL_39_110]OGW07177.1 MAG: hypothetical protein A2Z59_00265 [Nitrospinae bacterium RIFCSPLOWO2_02_39_17]OGW11713.1 MAG: hypothetical protein A2W75_02975 [Nitrospinae bacterium RIFCSPLOWO2_12_39_15]OGW12426.1 MAG: hypothe
MTLQGFDEDLIERVKVENEEFRVLYLEHHDLEQKLTELTRSKYLTPEQEVEKRRLQKIKLAGKDRMARILKQYESH